MFPEAGQPTDTIMKRISIGSWAYTIGPYADRPVDFETVMSRLSELGFDGVELGGFPPHPNPDDLPGKEQRAAVKARMAVHGLAFSGLAANLWSQHLVDADDPGAYLLEFTKNCGFCVDLGIQGIRVDTVQPPTLVDGIGQEPAMERVIHAFNEASRIAADHGLYVTWEFEPGFAFNKASEIQRVLDAVDQPNFGVLYDTSHGHMCAVVGARHNGAKEILPGGQVELIDRLSGRINHVHLIDSDNTCHKDADGADETSMHLPFGDGVVDFPPILEALARERLPHDWWTIDLCFWPDAWAATGRCKAAVDEFVAQYT
jgi:sugar phosphate isomerase/epimerase